MHPDSVSARKIIAQAGKVIYILSYHSLRSNFNYYVMQNKASNLFWVSDWDKAKTDKAVPVQWIYF